MGGNQIVMFGQVLVLVSVCEDDTVIHLADCFTEIRIVSLK